MSLDEKNKISATILLVDDEPSILSALRRVLRPEGYTLLTASNGQEGIDLLEKTEVDLIVSDMRMPGMTGADFFSVVKDRWPQTIRILLTGFSEISSLIDVVNRGKIYQVISKPWEDVELKLAIQHALEMRHLEKERDELLKLTQAQNYELEMDLEEKKRVSKELKTSKEKAEGAERLKSKFLMNMSHQIYNDMDSILGMLSLILESPLNDDQKEDAEMAHESAQRLMYLLDDMLILSQAENNSLSLDVVDFNLKNFLDHLLRLFMVELREKDLQLHTYGIDEVPEWLRGDPARLGYILKCYLRNAIRLTKTGSMQFRAKVVEKNEGEVKLRFSVVDRGENIEEEKLEKLFNTFEEIDCLGNSLGLTICKKISKLMDGEVGASHHANGGNEFWAEIILHPSKGIDYQKNKRVKINDLNIALVDLSGSSKKFIKHALLKWNANIELFYPEDIGKSAGENHYDVALLDFRLEQDPAFIEKLKSDERFENAKLILLSSSSLPCEAEKAKELGFSGYLTKPFSRDVLYHAVCTVSELSNEQFPLVTQQTLSDLGKTRSQVILLAMENEQEAQDLSGLLRQAYVDHVDIVHDGGEAITLFSRSEYDILLVDNELKDLDFALDMMIGMQSEEKSVPIILLNHEDKDNLPSGVALGARCPATLEEVRELLQGTADNRR